VRSRYNNSYIKIIELSKNYGFSIGNNIGAKHAKGDYLVFLNPDTKVDPDWLGNLVRVLESDPDIGAGQAKLLMLKFKYMIDHTGGFVNPIGLISVRGHNEIDKGQYNKICEIDFASGAAMIIRRELWEKLEGFDPIFFIYYEDIDLSWRVRNTGHKVVYIPQAKVYHAGGGVLNKVPFILKYNEAKGRIIFLLKNSTETIFIYMPFILLLYLLNILRYTLKGDIFTVRAIIEAIIWCFNNLKCILQKRHIR
jgi:hypothetical protein